MSSPPRSPTRRFKVPPHLTRFAKDFRINADNTYSINMGEAVAAFLSAIAPPHIVSYDWDTVRIYINPTLVTGVPFADRMHKMSKTPSRGTTSPTDSTSLSKSGAYVCVQFV